MSRSVRRLKRLSVAVDGEVVALPVVQSYVVVSVDERDIKSWEVVVNGLTDEQVRTLYGSPTDGVRGEVIADSVEGTQYSGIAYVSDMNPANRTAMMRGTGPLNGWDE